MSYYSWQILSITDKVRYNTHSQMLVDLLCIGFIMKTNLKYLISHSNQRGRRKVGSGKRRAKGKPRNINSGLMDPENGGD